jgi:hypothetical protein
MDIVRWTLVLPAALLGFGASIVLAVPMEMLIHNILWTIGQAMPGKMFLQYVLPYEGALAASLFIQFGVYAAPSRKQIVSLFLLVLGGIMAWQFVGEFYSPMHGVHNAATRVWWPIIGTYLGGIVTCAWIRFVSCRPSHRVSTTSPSPA